MTQELYNYIPSNAKELVESVLKKHPISIKIVNDRKTKHGDFKKNLNGKTEITLNNSLNKYQFLLTLMHEIAHFLTSKQVKFAKPHGIEWKVNFQHLMLPFMQPSIFPMELLPYLANYLKNPKASTGSDVNLTYALKQYNPTTNNTLLVELPLNTVFIYNNKKYKKGNLRRTRFECINIQNGKMYLFNQNAEVLLYK